jgi:uncharacterized repeat protein (TIGR02543 family)
MIKSRKPKNKESWKRIFPLLIVTCSLLCACGNPWMEKILDPLFNKEESLPANEPKDPEEPAYYTVTFNSNGGSDIAPITGLTGGSSISEPGAPAKGGYDCIFDGWYQDNSFTVIWNFGAPVTRDMILYAKWKAYAVGDTGPGGGIIFYRQLNGFTMMDDNSTCYYLEAAPVDMENGGDPLFKWASNGYVIDVEATEQSIGSGRNNTALILTAIDTNGPAAYACSEYRGGGCSDWFLPSVDELDEIYKLKTGSPIVFDSLALAEELYWSSSQALYPTGAWQFHFFDSFFTKQEASKGDSCRVRPVRTF